nr:transposase [Desulfobacter hydrogenophilus]
MEVEPASVSDAKAFIPIMESIQERNLCPKEIQADSLYGSDENHQAAQSEGIDLVAPTMGTTSKDKFSLSDFNLVDDGHIIECPEGHAPTHKTRKGDQKAERFIQAVHLDTCMNCPSLQNCPVKPGKKYAYYRYSAKSARIAQRRQHEQTDEFKSQYRWRAGVEATMSELDRRTGLKRLRYRGMKSVRFAATMKAVGINIFRATVARKVISYA